MHLVGSSGRRPKLIVIPLETTGTSYLLRQMLEKERKAVLCHAERIPRDSVQNLNFRHALDHKSTRLTRHTG